MRDLLRLVMLLGVSVCACACVCMCVWMCVIFCRGKANLSRGLRLFWRGSSLRTKAKATHNANCTLWTLCRYVASASCSLVCANLVPPSLALCVAPLQLAGSVEFLHSDVEHLSSETLIATEVPVKSVLCDVVAHSGGSRTQCVTGAVLSPGTSVGMPTTSAWLCKLDRLCGQPLRR